MKHTMNEIYQVNHRGKIYTREYVEENKIKDARTVGYMVSRDEIKIYTTEGIKFGYVYGEKTWFDTREERDAYREEQAKARAEMVAKNKVIKAINEKLKEMNEAELLELLKNI
jgi:hypothetical protein